MGYFIVANKYWRSNKAVITNDAILYYEYLPAIFIYEDPSLDFMEEGGRDQDIIIWYSGLEDGKKVIKMTMGVSYFYFPFFIIAHQLADTLGYKANGYSLPYRMAICISTFFYFLMGLLFLRKYLLNFFTEMSVFWTILIVGLGTNIVNYVVKDPGMSHVYSFFLAAVFLYHLHEWYNQEKFRHLLIVGITLALLSLVRPINVLVIFIFIFYGIDSFDSFKRRFFFFLKRYKEIICAAIAGFVLIVPQLFYWKYNTGHWIFYSYFDERFFFNDPKFIDGLFSYRKGWLLYTPLMALSILGLFVPSRKLNKYKASLGIFLLIYLYITFSWWCWWYGGSFGMRPLIDIYPFLVLPIAIVVEKLYRQSVLIRSVSSLAIAALIYLNLFQNYQYREGIIHHDAMTKESYWLVWGESEIVSGYWESLDYTDPEAAKNGIR